MIRKMMGEFTDEDTWFRIFKKRNLVYIGVGILFTLLSRFIFNIFSEDVIGIIAGIIFTVVITALSMIPVPESNFLKGKNITLDIILVRRFIRICNRCIYVKGWGK